MRQNDISLDREQGEIKWLENNRNEKLDSKILESAQKTWEINPKHIDMKPHINYA